LEYFTIKIVVVPVDFDPNDLTRRFDGARFAYYLLAIIVARVFGYMPTAGQLRVAF